MAIGLFTDGIDLKLPHPPIPLRVTLLVCKVIRKAWRLMIEHPPSGFELQAENEKNITWVLIDIIENRLRKSGEIEGFNPALFGRVTRDQKIANIDGSHPDKMPDMHFDLKREHLPILSTQDGLFVECKPVDRKHPLLSCYCRKGLIRFVVGDYAWAMQDALMIGYVAASYSFKNLESTLKAKKNAVLVTIDHGEITEFSIYRSVHERHFEWPENQGKACRIAVSHLWLPIRSFP